MAKPRKMKVIANEEDFKQQKTGDAGFDLRIHEDITLYPGEPAVTNARVKVAIPSNCVGIIAPRSSMGKRGVTLPNSIGVIDSGYRGDIKIMLINHKKHPQTVFAGERVAQLIVIPLQPVEIEYVNDLDKTERGEGGVGSTGKK
jgi:dUTP pyrophosphatase